MHRIRGPVDPPPGDTLTRPPPPPPPPPAACTGLLPAPLIGPLLGIIGVYVADRGDLSDVRNQLFPPRNSKGQFKSS
jgi:hypothetical protein